MSIAKKLICALFALAAVTPALAIEDPGTTTAKTSLQSFCQSLNGKQGSQGENCFNIFGRYTGVILAAAATKDPEGRCREAQLLLDNFADVPGVQDVATQMAKAKINAIPPETEPKDIPCGPIVFADGGNSNPPNEPSATVEPDVPIDQGPTETAGAGVVTITVTETVCGPTDAARTPAVEPDSPVTDDTAGEPTPATAATVEACGATATAAPAATL
ncbi:hypothetical protein BC832DRAFT_590546 [Gaertneriomyces semiglobifer]|nr:hypothetical protein BC832DRAFT_590546 [Gaertneriomyces semiglobifer]